MAETATYRIWVTPMLFDENGFPSIGTFGASESNVVIMTIATWKRLCEDVPQLRTTLVEVGSQGVAMAADLDLPALIAWVEATADRIRPTLARSDYNSEPVKRLDECAAALRQLQSQGAAIRLAREATNGWACYAKTEKEHAEITRLHRDIDRIVNNKENTMRPHQERVVTEKRELDEKLDKLKAFIETNATFKTLAADEQGRLNRQFDAMAEYSSDPEAAMTTERRDERPEWERSRPGERT